MLTGPCSALLLSSGFPAPVNLQMVLQENYLKGFIQKLSLHSFRVAGFQEIITLSRAQLLLRVFTDSRTFLPSPKNWQHILPFKDRGLGPSPRKRVMWHRKTTSSQVWSAMQTGQQHAGCYSAHPGKRRRHKQRLTQKMSELSQSWSARVLRQRKAKSFQWDIRSLHRP